MMSIDSAGTVPSRRRRLCLIAVALAAGTLLAAALLWQRLSTHHLEPSQFLAHVVQLEQTKDLAPISLQSLGWNLAILGRDDEVRNMNFFPQFQRPPSNIDEDRLQLHLVPWVDGLQQITADNRLVMIMEDHFVSKHRELIGAALPLFRRAGFTHYAAEAIGRFDTSLAERGYPVSSTGLYTSDPQFGNTLRQALALDFTVRGYDHGFSTHDDREEFAANQLAKLFQNSAETRLLVHAGHAHVLKYDTDPGQRWLAARLWEKTGIEPFTIWQWSSAQDAADYAAIVRVLKERSISLEEPLLLTPPPDADCGLRDPPYGLARVDAILLHPPDQSVAPAERTTLFPERMQRISGRWMSNVWPVVISAYKQGEPVNAIPLDQVLLRQTEDRFLLWVPAGMEYELRVCNSRGVLASRSEVEAEFIAVKLAAEP